MKDTNIRKERNPTASQRITGPRRRRSTFE